MNNKNQLLKYSIMLLLVLTALTIFSFSGLKLSIFNHDIKLPSIRDFLTSTPPSSVNKEPEMLVNKDSVSKIRKIDTASQRILMVGESMIEGLMFPFMKYAAFNHDYLKAKIWYGARFMDWAKDDTLKKVIEEVKPTFIMISVGANELYIRNIAEREPYVKDILKQMEGYHYIWIGPPVPSKDYGICDIIEKNTGEDRFFMSKYMDFDRVKDGVHPTRPSSRKWADSIATWIMDKSRYPIMLKRPTEGTAPTPPPKRVPVKKKTKKASIAPYDKKRSHSKKAS